MEFELEPIYKKQTSKLSKKSASRQFTDREKPREAFKNALKAKQEMIKQRKVLTYYGVGGIGKTRLQNELFQLLGSNYPSTIKAIIDFKEENLREPSNALIWLSEILKKQYKIKFTTFDLAYAVYWSKLHPQLNLKESAGSLPFLEEGTFIAELLDQLQFVPLAQWVPNTLKFIKGLTKYKDMLNWWVGSGKWVLEEVQDLMPNEIEKRLPMFWAEDLKNHLQENPVPIVLFVDTYEALWEKHRNLGVFDERDQWVRELVLQLPEVLWVICGREKLRWGEESPAWNAVLEQHLIGELSKKDSDQFLISCNISQEDIRKVIIESSKGLPYYLDLMVDTYNLIQVNQIPTVSNFSKTPKKILQRFMQYLEASEKSTIKILSFPRFWDEEIFITLVTRYKTGYEIFDFQDLFRFSFISEREGKDDQWVMHTIMRESLQEDIKNKTEKLYLDIHQCLFNIYDEKLSVTNSKHADVSELFREAFYHSSMSHDRQKSLEWFLEVGGRLQRSGQFQLIKSMYQDVLPLLHEIQDQLLKYSVLQYYGKTFLMQGNYVEAIKCYNLALEGYKTLSGIENPTIIRLIGVCSMELAEIMIHTADYEKAYVYLSHSEHYYLSYIGQKDNEYYYNRVLQQIRLGKLNIRFSKYDESKKNYNQAIALGKEALAIQSHNPAIFSLMALAFEKLGELYGSSHFLEQEECYLKSIEFYNKALAFKDEIDYIRTLANKGLAHKRLAEHYDMKTSAELKLKNYQRSVNIYNEVLLLSPDFVDCLEKKGHALVDFMVLQRELSLYDQALESFRTAIQTFERVLVLSPKQGGSKNRIGSAYRELGLLYSEKGEAILAAEAFQKSLHTYQEMLDAKSEYIYIHNSMGKTYRSMGEFYIKQGDLELAKQHYGLAILQFKKMLQRAPELRGAKRDIKEIENRLSVI